MSPRISPFPAIPAHANRYERAEEFVDLVKDLWDSYEDDAFIRDKESGVFLDPDKVHQLNHKGAHFTVAGPLNVAPPAPGLPGDRAGRRFGSRAGNWRRGPRK